MARNSRGVRAHRETSAIEVAAAATVGHAAWADAGPSRPVADGPPSRPPASGSRRHPARRPGERAPADSQIV